MNRYNLFLVLGLLFSLFSCKGNRTDKKLNKTVVNSSTELRIDHVNIWVKNPKKAKEKLIEIEFSSVPDSLSEIHKGQGTSGRYFYFLMGILN